MDVWVRRCSSFAEEAAADAEFWAAMTAEQRVAAMDEVRNDFLRATGAPDERLRRVLRVFEPAKR
jgi:hypothetical protein